MAYKRVLQEKITPQNAEDSSFAPILIGDTAETAGLHMDVVVNRSILPEMNTAKITIYNIDTDTQDSIPEQCVVQIIAGYSDQGSAVIYTGIIAQMEYRKEGSDYITELYCITTTYSVGKGSEQYYHPRNLLLKTVNYPADYGDNKILKELCEFANYTLLDERLSDSADFKGKPPFSFTGTIDDGIKKLKQRVSPDWAIFNDNNIVCLYKTDGSTPINTVYMTFESGLKSVAKSKTQLKPRTRTLVKSQSNVWADQVKSAFDKWLGILRPLLEKLKARAESSEGLVALRPAMVELNQKAQEFWLDINAILAGYANHKAAQETIGFNGDMLSLGMKATPGQIFPVLDKTRGARGSVWSYADEGLKTLDRIDAAYKVMIEEAARAAKEKSDAESERINKVATTIGQVLANATTIKNDLATQRTGDGTTTLTYMDVFNAINTGMQIPLFGSKADAPQIWAEYLSKLSLNLANNATNSSPVYVLSNFDGTVIMQIATTRNPGTNSPIAYTWNKRVSNDDSTELEKRLTLLIGDLSDIISKLKKVGSSAADKAPTVTIIEKPSSILFMVTGLFHPMIRPNGIINVPYVKGGVVRYLENEFDPGGSANWQPLSLLVEAVVFELSNYSEKFDFSLEGSITAEKVVLQ